MKVMWDVIAPFIWSPVLFFGLPCAMKLPDLWSVVVFARLSKVLPPMLGYIYHFQYPLNLGQILVWILCLVFHIHSVAVTLPLSLLISSKKWCTLYPVSIPHMLSMLPSFSFWRFITQALFARPSTQNSSPGGH